MNLPEIDLTRCSRDGVYTVGRVAGCDFIIDHSSVSRRHADIKRENGSDFRLTDQNSSFGTFVNKLRIASRVLKAGDIVRFGAGVPYEFENGRLIPCPESVGLAIQLEGLSYNLKDGRAVLRQLTADIASDEFVGIVGPSGCGKSTLLACLTGDYTFAGGAITFDENRDIRNNRDYFRQKTGVVPQKNLLFEDLTVRENLRFSLMIKQPELPPGETEELVDAAIEAVSLTESQDLPVAVLSGGQKKRASVAVELTSHPRLLLLDEPTSGLDPLMEADLFDKLKALSQRGTTVVCVAHTTNMRFFDKVILLRAAGDNDLPSVAFCGPPEEIPQTDVLSGRSLSKKHDHFPQELRLQGETPEVVIARPKCENTFFKNQARTVFRRSFVSCLRDRKALLLTTVLPVLTAIMIVASQRVHSQQANMGFFITISVFWFGMTSSVREIIKERNLYVRDKLCGLIPTAYFVGKTAYAAVLATFQALVLFTAVALVLTFFHALGQRGGLELLVNKITLFAAITSVVPVIVASLGGALAGLTVSILSSSERMAVTALPMILLPQILFSRVALGQAGETTTKPPFGMISQIPDSGWIDCLLYLVSLGFITRPCSLVMHLCFVASGATPWGDKSVEWIYMLLLLALYVIIANLAFIHFQKRWKDWR